MSIQGRYLDFDESGLRVVAYVDEDGKSNLDFHRDGNYSVGLIGDEVKELLDWLGRIEPDIIPELF